MPQWWIDERPARRVVDQDHGRDRQSPERIDGYQTLFWHHDIFLRMKAAPALPQKFSKMLCFNA
jgi:hypothetical protein